MNKPSRLYASRTSWEHDQSHDWLWQYLQKVLVEPSCLLDSLEWLVWQCLLAISSNQLTIQVPSTRALGTLVTLPLWLLRSAGFSVVGTRCHRRLVWLCIFWIWFAKNWGYSPLSWSQWRATVLSNQHWMLVARGKPSNTLRTFTAELAAIWPETSSKRGIVSPCLARHDLAVTKPFITPVSCVTTA